MVLILDIAEAITQPAGINLKYSLKEFENRKKISYKYEMVFLLLFLFIPIFFWISISRKPDLDYG